MLSSPKWPLY